MRRAKRMVGFLVGATLISAFPAQATVLTFDVDGIAPGQIINQSYGDRVTGTSDAVGDYGQGAEGTTGNILVDYGTVTPSLWTSGYSDLTNVFFDNADGQGPLAITLTADVGYQVLLYEFDLGSWSTNSTVPAIQVLDQDNNVLYELLSETILFNAHTNFSFNGPLSGESLRIIIDQANLGGASDNVGIDNVRFGQTSSTAPIPEPATMTLLGLGATALAIRNRRKQV